MTANSLGRYSEIGITTVRAFLDKVTSINGTTITVDDDYDYVTDAGYVDGTFAVLSGTSIDKMEDIASTTASGNLIVLDTSIAGLAVDDVVAIIPKPLTYVCIESESLKETINWDDTKCLQDWENMHHTPLTVDVGGDLGIFLGEDCIANDMLFNAAMGVHSATSGLAAGSLHTYSPGTADDLTLIVMRGNHVSLQVYGGCKLDTLVIDQPSGGNATLRATIAGGFGIQEIGGADKTFSTGDSGFWDPSTDIERVGKPKRYHFRHLDRKSVV